MCRKIFSLSEEVHFSDYHPKIEITNCPNELKICVAQLPLINQCFCNSHRSFIDKDYQRSINELKQAFDCTYEVSDSACINCIELFRSTIISSLEAIHFDLGKMTSGWFRFRRYESELKLATEVLNECRMRK